MTITVLGQVGERIGAHPGYLFADLSPKSAEAGEIAEILANALTGCAWFATEADGTTLKSCGRPVVSASVYDVGGGAAIVALCADHEDAGSEAGGSASSAVAAGCPFGR
jgi:hypothetical protein